MSNLCVSIENLKKIPNNSTPRRLESKFEAESDSIHIDTIMQRLDEFRSYKKHMNYRAAIFTANGLYHRTKDLVDDCYWWAAFYILHDATALICKRLGIWSLIEMLNAEVNRLSDSESIESKPSQDFEEDVLYQLLESIEGIFARDAKEILTGCVDALSVLLGKNELVVMLRKEAARLTERQERKGQ